MKKKTIFISAIAILLGAMKIYAQDGTEAQYHKWAPTPPMGWNSWDCFGAGATETQILQNAEYMRDNLKEFGWEYVVLDIRWYVAESVNYYIFPATYTIDEWGRYIPPATRFPNGFKSMADKIHDMGLKFGIHIMRGLPIEAAKRKLPVKGANGVTCDMICNNDSACTWLNDNYKVITSANGQLYYNSIFDQYAEWGVDFVKIDDISRPFHEGEVSMIRKAIDQCGRPIVLSLSPGATDLRHGPAIGNYANMWRMTDDLWDRWGDVYAIFEKAAKWAPYYRPGCYPDADMIPIGALDYASNFKDHRMSKLTDYEQETLMNLWGITHSPLMYGGNLPANTEKELRLMTNKDLIEMNQYGVNAREIYNESGKVVWSSINPATGNHYACLFNIKGSTGQSYSTEGALYTTQVLAYTLPYEDVEADIPLGSNLLTLLCDDAGDGNAYDHGDWINARFVLDNGEEIFIDDSHILFYNVDESYYKHVNINKNVTGGKLIVAGTEYDKGIGCHATSLIYVSVPKIEGREVKKFKARCGVDAGVGSQITSMRFRIFNFDPTPRTNCDPACALANSGLVSRNINFSSGVDIVADITGQNIIHLVVTGYTDGFAYDRANWIDPVLVADDGSKLSLVNLTPESYRSDFGALEKNRNVERGTLNIGGTEYTTGLGMNSEAVAKYTIPAGKNYIRFEAKVGLDYSVLKDAPADNQRTATVEFMVFGEELLPNGMVPVTLPLNALGFEENRECLITDLWSKEELGIYKNDEFQVVLEPHQSGFYLVTPLNREEINDIIKINSLDENKLVDVYCVSGQKIRSQVLKSDAAKGLSKGIYIVGNHKMFIN